MTQIINRKEVWHSAMFCTGNTVQTEHVNVNVKNRQAAVEQQIRGSSPSQSKYSPGFLHLFNGNDSLSRNVSKEIPLYVA